MEDIIGSPYAITEYVVNPEICTLEDLKKLKQSLNDMGLELMLDFVPNHSATDGLFFLKIKFQAPWVKEHIEYYVRAPKGTEPPFDPMEYTSEGVSYGSSGFGDFWKFDLSLLLILGIHVNLITGTCN